MLVAVHLSISGSYLPPEFSTPLRSPPQTIISAPVQMAVSSNRPIGAPAVVVGLHASEATSYCQPRFTGSVLKCDPLHTIIPPGVATKECWLSAAGTVPVKLVGVHVSDSGS